MRVPNPGPRGGVSGRAACAAGWSHPSPLVSPSGVSLSSSDERAPPGACSPDQGGEPVAVVLRVRLPLRVPAPFGPPDLFSGMGVNHIPSDGGVH